MLVNPYALWAGSVNSSQLHSAYRLIRYALHPSTPPPLTEVLRLGLARSLEVLRVAGRALADLVSEISQVLVHVAAHSARHVHAVGKRLVEVRVGDAREPFSGGLLSDLGALADGGFESVVGGVCGSLFSGQDLGSGKVMRVHWVTCNGEIFMEWNIRWTTLEKTLCSPFKNMLGQPNVA